jgi:hypothetical protein
MATLEQAFYTHFEIEAHVVRVNALDTNAIDHAATMVRISGHLDEFRRILGDIVSYEIGEGVKDVYGNPVTPGIYMLVDNSYSDVFGSLSGGLQPGTFRIHSLIPLERGYAAECSRVVSTCAIAMD